MSVYLAVGVSVVFSAASTFANCLWGTILAVIPVASWIVFLAMTARGGISDSESEILSLSMLGIMVGILLGQAIGRPMKRDPHST